MSFGGGAGGRAFSKYLMNVTDYVPFCRLSSKSAEKIQIISLTVVTVMSFSELELVILELLKTLYLKIFMQIASRPNTTLYMILTSAICNERSAP